MNPAPKADGVGRPRPRARVRDRVVELLRVPAGQLREHPGNWRRHPERQRAALRGVLREIGYADALLARRDGEELVLIDGHLRRSLDPHQVVPVLVLDVSEHEADTLLATLDPLAGMARPDPVALSAILDRVETSSRAVMDLLAEIARGAGLPSRALRGDPDAVPDLPRTPRTKRGDLWILGEHRLLCGDATDPADMARLMDGQRADVVWTDPPYGVEYTGKTKDALTIDGDTPSGLAELLAKAFAAVDGVLAEGGRLYVAHPAGALSAVFLRAFLDQGWRLHQTLVWVKDRMVLGHADYHYRHEPIAYGYAGGPGRWGRGGKGWYGGNGVDSVLEVPRPAAAKVHPTMKPVELIRRCLANSSRMGDRILDPFCGSGTTLVACDLMGRQALAMELDPVYCDVVAHRYEQLTGQEAIRRPG
jgi:DNA modification methylase